MPAPDPNKITDANVITKNFVENPFFEYIFNKIDTTNAEDMDELWVTPWVLIRSKTKAPLKRSESNRLILVKLISTNSIAV